MRLGSWMEASGYDDHSLAREIMKYLPQGQGCSASGVRKWRFGERVPRPSRMKVIRQITDGKVTPNDFADLPDRSAVSHQHEPSKAGETA